ncbi:MAG: endonuclease MutS2 [Dehalococcoidia bacterium]
MVDHVGGAGLRYLPRYGGRAGNTQVHSVSFGEGSALDPRQRSYCSLVRTVNEIARFANAARQHRTPRPPTIEEPGAHPPRSIIDDRTLTVLEFPAVLDRLARLTSFSAGRETALALRPLSDRDAAAERQRELAEAIHLDQAGVEVSLGGAHDVRERAEAAGRGQTLAVTDLLEVAGTIRSSERVRRALVRVTEDTPLLSTVAGGMADLAPLRGLIERSIDDRGEVADAASADLASIRRELNAAHDRLQQRVQAMLRAADVRAALQEPLVTIRMGRYVFPVRAEARGAVPGVVHDTSASGATVYVEPFAVVELGNRWRELQLHERHEVERILRELSGAVGEAAEDLVDVVAGLATVDCALARARLARELRATALHRRGAAQSWLRNSPAPLRLVSARHPLLPGEVVPITLEVGGEAHALLVTGPNTGGKTVALKTAGLLCLMAMSGLPVPAEEGSQLPVYEAVFADIGDEQSIAQSLSTFSGHVTNIIDIIERAGDRSLVLLDELGAGTDPTEGAALAIAIVERLRRARVTLIATTHHSELKLYAHHTADVMNASVEFDLETLAPTYRLTLGLPGQSNALAIASRLGMPADVIAEARSGLSSEQQDMEHVLADLRRQLTAAEERAASAAATRDAAEALRRDYEARLDALTNETAELRAEARRKVRAELREAERLVQRTRRQVEAARLEQANVELTRARRAMEALPPEPEPPPAPPSPGRPESREPIAPGVLVWLRGIPGPGEALSAPGADGEFDVQLGALRTRVRMQQVERSARGTGAPAPRIPAPPPPANVANEIEVRGQTLDEAMPRVEEFLDLAARAGKHRVYLIHGKGTGTLRRAVRELLDRHPLVTSYETATRHEGGEGVTVAYLAGVH